MGDAAYRGISIDHGDSRFSRRQEKDLAALASKGKFPVIFAQKLDVKKVNLDVIRPWIADKTKELLGFEDDVVTEYAVGMLEGDDNRFPDPKKMQLGLTGFLESQTPEFMAALWALLLDAQASPGGIPRELVEKKKAELAKARAEDAQALRGAGLGGRGGRGERGGSRWGPPGRGGDSYRGGGGSGGRAPPGGFKDKSGNVTERVQDVGWGNHRGGVGEGDERGAPPSRVFDRGPAPPRGYDERGPPPRDYRGPPPPRDYDAGSRYPAARGYDAPSRDDMPRYEDRRGSGRYSPPRRERHEYSPPRRARDVPPPRSARDDTPPLRRRRDYSSSPQRARDDKASPPRHRRDDSPPRRRRGSASYDSRGDRSRSRTRSPPPAHRRHGRSPSYSRSRTRSPAPRSRHRASYSRSRSRSPSRSVTPPPRRQGASARDYTRSPSPQARRGSLGGERDTYREASPPPQPLRKKSRWD